MDIIGFDGQFAASLSRAFSLMAARHHRSGYLLALGEMMGEAKQKGMTQASIEQLPTIKHEKKPDQKEGEGCQDCSVCMTPYDDGDELRILPCFHQYHTQCIDKWLKTNATCPVCRVAVRLEG